MKLFNFSKKEDRMPMSSAKKKKIKAIIAVILVIAVGAGAFMYFSGKKDKTAGSEINTATAKIGNVRSAISASGTIEPINMYEVTALVKGDVISANFEEGDIVEQDDILYQIDPTEMENTLERAKLSMERTRESYDDTASKVDKLNIKAPINGTITEMYIKKGDTVSNGTKICDIIDKSKMVLSISFNEADADMIYAGQSAEVILENSFYSTKGTVTRVSTGSLVNENGVSVCFVDILVDNPGAIAKGDTATAIVGDAACNSAGTFDYYQVKTVTAEVNGEIVSLYEGKGNNVTENGIIAVIESESVSDSLKDSKRSLREAEISLQNTYDQLDNYTIKAPIKGTIIEKNVKAGDKMDNGSNSKIMCVIADLSTIIFTINVDELDIDKIELNQKVDITADALPSNRFVGHVSNININGSTSNGVTTYPVEIVVDNPEGLLPGMNVNAEIVIAEKYNVLTIPVTAVMRGNVVYVKDDGSSSGKKDGEKVNPGFDSKAPVNKDMPMKSDAEDTEESPSDAEGSASPTDSKGQMKKESSKAPSTDGIPTGKRPLMNTENSGERRFSMGEKNTENAEAKKNIPESKSSSDEKAPMGSKTPDDMKAPENSTPSTESKTPSKSTPNGAQNSGGGQQRNFGNVPEGFRAVIVTTGLSDENNIEITSGLSEGDIVYVRAQVTSTSGGMMGGMGAMGGRMPMGGMGGGMPSMGGQNRASSQNRNMGGNR